MTSLLFVFSLSTQSDVLLFQLPNFHNLATFSSISIGPTEYDDDDDGGGGDGKKHTQQCSGATPDQCLEVTTGGAPGGYMVPMIKFGLLHTVSVLQLSGPNSGLNLFF